MNVILNVFQRKVRTEAQSTTGKEDDPQSGYTLETPSTSHDSLSTPRDIQRTHTIQRLASSSSDEETDELGRQCAQLSKRPQHTHELFDFQISLEIIDLPNQIPPVHNSIVQNLGDDDDKEDTVEWNEDEELEQTDEDQDVKITWNENIIQVMWSLWAECHSIDLKNKYSNYKH